MWILFLCVCFMYGNCCHWIWKQKKNHGKHLWQTIFFCFVSYIDIYTTDRFIELIYWYFSLLSSLLLLFVCFMNVNTYPTASHSPVGQNPNENICELKSYWCNCRPSRRSQCRTVLSRPPVHNLLPSKLISIQEAPSVWPWNCRTKLWLWRSHTAIFPSEQQLKQTFESGDMANA